MKNTITEQQAKNIYDHIHKVMATTVCDIIEEATDDYSKRIELLLSQYEAIPFITTRLAIDVCHLLGITDVIVDED